MKTGMVGKRGRWKYECESHFSWQSDNEYYLKWKYVV